MFISVFDLFKIGIGPSSSHTVGPMRAAAWFARNLESSEQLHKTVTLRVELFGSLGLTGKGHGSDLAVLLGLEGEDPETVNVDTAAERVATIRARRSVAVLGRHPVALDPATDLVFHRRQVLPGHSNGLRFTATDAGGEVLRQHVYYSVGGGFVTDESGKSMDIAASGPELPHPFDTGADLLNRCNTSGLSISTLMLENEATRHSPEEVRARLLTIAGAMEACIQRGCGREGILPGGLKVRRRAAALHRKLKSDPRHSPDPLALLDHVNLFALAVNEENAAGGRVVTAPTNGAAGVIPAVLEYYKRFIPGSDQDGIVRFLLTAAAIGTLYKKNASISGAEVGCQGEVGVACSMAAGALTEVMGGTPAQVENAAEIGMEHNLGLTCDPIGGLVQVPCIERNAMGAVKAINAARLALQGDGSHKVSLDKVIATMRQTGADMSQKYKETARGGLAVNVVEC